MQARIYEISVVGKPILPRHLRMAVKSAGNVFELTLPFHAVLATLAPRPHDRVIDLEVNGEVWCFFNSLRVAYARLENSI